MKLTKAQETKVVDVKVFGAIKEGKYLVTLKEGYKNNNRDKEFFNTQKEVKEFINGAELVEAVEELKYKSFFSNEVTAKDDIQIINTAREGSYFNGYTTLRLSNLREGIEGRDLLLDTVLKELVKYKKELANGHKVDVYITWNLSDDGMEYEDCKVVKTAVSTFNSHKERLEARCKALGYELESYDNGIENLSEEAFNEVLECSSEEYTDVIVKSGKTTYVVEIATINGEKDFMLYTKGEYIYKYGDEKFQNE